MVVQPGQYPMVFHEASHVQEMKRMKDALPSGLRIGKERGSSSHPDPGLEEIQDVRYSYFVRGMEWILLSYFS